MRPIVGALGALLVSLVVWAVLFDVASPVAVSAPPPEKQRFDGRWCSRDGPKFYCAQPQDPAARHWYESGDLPEPTILQLHPGWQPPPSVKDIP